MATELERFRDHARRMATTRQPVKLPASLRLGGEQWVMPSDEERAEWKRLADEADEQIRRDEIEAGLFEVELVDPAEPGLW